MFTTLEPGPGPVERRVNAVVALSDLRVAEAGALSAAVDLYDPPNAPTPPIDSLITGTVR